LLSPGGDYNRAFGTVYEAAVHFLNLSSSMGQLPIKGEEAINALQSLRFELLRLDEFIGRFRGVQDALPKLRLTEERTMDPMAVLTTISTSLNIVDKFCRPNR
jgi:hypothetical protein